MNRKIYAIYDVKVGAYQIPFFRTTAGEAIREWDDAVNEEKSPFSKHPEDYSLFELGDYDNISGTFQNYTAPKPLGSAMEYRRQTEKN